MFGSNLDLNQSLGQHIHTDTDTDNTHGTRHALESSVHPHHHTHAHTSIRPSDSFNQPNGKARQGKARNKPFSPDGSREGGRGGKDLCVGVGVGVGALDAISQINQSVREGSKVWKKCPSTYLHGTDSLTYMAGWMDGRMNAAVDGGKGEGARQGKAAVSE